MDYFIADTHFYHKNIIKLCKRPFVSIAKMNNVILNNWNNVVSKDDTVYVLGDFLWSKNKEILNSMTESLNGRKILILGNHDELSPWAYLDAGFESVHTSLEYKIPCHPFGQEPSRIILAHDPAVRSVLNKNDKLIHGHIHTLYQTFPEKNCINVGVDVWNFTPISFDTIWETMKW